jgi:alanine dehydrogenase
MSIQEGAKYLEKPLKGRGILLGGVPGVKPAKVLVLGGGVVGTNAAKIAAGMGADVTILDLNLTRLRYLDDVIRRMFILWYQTNIPFVSSSKILISLSVVYWCQVQKLRS